LNIVSEVDLPKPPHPRISFAIDYSSSWTTLNASSTLFRCESFLQDIEIAKRSIKLLQDSGEWTPWFGLEIFSYYAVGFVTCLEWHARSRLVDLFNFKPSCVQADDLKGHINDKVLSQMVASNVGIAEVLGGFLSVGSIDTYFSTINRVFKELNIRKSEAEILAELVSDHPSGARVDLAQLFENRHRLVHEISQQEIGAWPLRSNIDLSEAQRLGQLIISTIRIIEREITLHAPGDFPNRLTVDGLEEDQVNFMDGEIKRLEEEIAAKLVENAVVIGENTAVALWKACVHSFSALFEAQREFLDECSFPGERYVDYRRPILVGLKRAHLRHLKSLSDHF
jgi:hypothetical protein